MNSLLIKKKEVKHILDCIIDDGVKFIKEYQEFIPLLIENINILENITISTEKKEDLKTYINILIYTISKINPNSFLGKQIELNDEILLNKLNKIYSEEYILINSSLNNFYKNSVYKNFFLNLYQNNNFYSEFNIKLILQSFLIFKLINNI